MLSFCYMKIPFVRNVLLALWLQFVIICDIIL